MVHVKYLSSVALGFLATLPLVQSAFQCPTKDIKQTKCAGPTDCRYADPTNCANFIHCTVNADGKTATPNTETCPSGLLWRDALKFCDYPSTSGCTNSLQVTAAQALGQLPPLNGILSPNLQYDCNGQCPPAVAGIGNTCVFTDVNSTTSYIQCADNLAFTVKCSSGLVYNPAVQACDTSA
jgi:hypothetical protein